jgi:Predicted ATP-binding protein involved in virulence
MKLISVKILGENFRSLSSNKLYKFNHAISDEKKLSTKIFAGLNGSGKSNFLELFSEIFYFLEVCHLDTVSSTERANKGFGFEIEYLLPKTVIGLELLFEKDLTEVKEDYINSNLSLTKFTRKKFEKAYSSQINELRRIEVEKLIKTFIKEEFIHVRIEKALDGVPTYYLVSQDGKKTPRQLHSKTQEALPTKVIAYTSGQNELLSNPYHKLKYHYFRTFEDRKNHGYGEKLADSHRLFFLDYNTNFSIFVANVLIANKEKTKILKEALKINDLQSFRITINTDELYKKVIPVNEKLATDLRKLKLCATSWIEKKIDDNRLLVMDFTINDATKEAFEFHFHNAFDLFKVFYELEIFNLYLVEKKTRDLLLQVHKSYNFSDELSKPDPSRLVFRIEKIFIRKSMDNDFPFKNIYYKALSDGEHQFNEVIGTILMMEQEGCLFLIDEPDTHFNPKWRAKLIKMFNQMAAVAYDAKGNITKVRKQEIIITTHSPFVISDSSKEDVYRFSKVNGIIDYSNPIEQTYGASIAVILDEIFDKGETISYMAKKELDEMLDNVDDVGELREIIQKLNLNFGDSVEKFDLFSKIKNIRNKIEKMKK